MSKLDTGNKTKVACYSCNKLPKNRNKLRQVHNYQCTDDFPSKLSRWFENSINFLRTRTMLLPFKNIWAEKNCWLRRKKFDKIQKFCESFFFCCHPVAFFGRVFVEMFPWMRDLLLFSNLVNYIFFSAFDRIRTHIILGWHLPLCLSQGTLSNYLGNYWSRWALVGEA